MKSLRLFDRRVGFSLGALSILLGMVAPAVLPTFASAAQLSSRSIQMSDSTAYSAGPPVTGNNVTYTVNFTPTTSATDMIIYFCSNSPLVGASCTAPTGMDLSSATPGTGALDTTDSSNPGANKIAIKSLTLTATPTTITISGVRNPSTANATFYARIETFDTNGHQESSWTAGPTDTTIATQDGDYGGVALSTTNQIGVTAAVLESLQFCTFGDGTRNGPSPATGDSASYLSGLANANNGPHSNCTDNSDGSPSIPLGETVTSGVTALSTSTPSYGSGWSQISTNAGSGAMVYLKDLTTCSASTPHVGLVLNNSTTCGIPSVGGSTTTNAGGALTAGTAGFGIKFGGGSTPSAFATPDLASTGTGIDFNDHYTSTSGGYGLTTTGNTLDSAFAGNSGVSGAQDVTSNTGAFVFGTSGGPATNWDIPFGVGAAIAANTPAGQYKANLSLIAVGTF